jgi:nanoRNase/pAp phosphatase (c-di-AMP/oligoRNAs hydrolase)
MQIGDIEYSKQQKSVERLANISFKTWWGGHNVAILNAISSTVSHVAERLRKTSKYKLCVGFSYITEHGEPKICLSVRSDGSFNVAEFCSHYGGGGHLCSGGFSLRAFTRVPRRTRKSTPITWHAPCKSCVLHDDIHMISIHILHGQF